MTRVFKDHFSACSADYAAFRPTYPQALIDYLCGIAPARGTELDCGCGSGQLSTMLADRFVRVIAIDASAGQIENAKPHARVEYRRARAEATGLDAASVDLVSVAQAAHWFDLDAFYAEVRRVLRPDGAVALIAYGVVETDGTVGAVLSRFYYHTLGGFWPAERCHVEAGYRSLAFPFTELAAPVLAMKAWWSADELLGYIGTWSAVGKMEAALGREPFERFAAALKAAWSDPNAQREFRWPLAMRAGRA